MPTYKGAYDESMTAAIAAFRAGNAPHILQVFEVGTATMMASKGAIVPVGEGDGRRRLQVRSERPTSPPSSATTRRRTARCCRMPFNSSTTVFYYNKDAFKAAGLDPDKPPKTWPEVALGRRPS